MGQTIFRDIDKELQDSYLNYAMSVIVSRAIPDVRDGLKPVHRRILHSMNEMGLQSNKQYKKAGRIVGDVLGKFHPHGDQAIYDTLVRMAQDFSLRYPAVDGHGNFGSIDGDPPAAMRYTEAKMSKIADLMLKDINKDTVDFGPNYDESMKEPLVIPSAVPFLLINGTSGIAVGMSTNIPPYNITEVVEAITKQIDNPEIDIDDIIKIIKGPDFPTGGFMYGREGARKAMRTGRGAVIIRSKMEVEEIRPGKEAIIVTEIPYMEKKSDLIIKVAELVKNDKIQGISEIRDESDRDGLRIVIELKKSAVTNVVINQLYSHTNFQKNFNIINLALDKGVPKVLNIKQTIQAYIDFRMEVIYRRTRFELKKAEERAHILLGLLIALDNLDEVIRIIRQSKDRAEAKPTLMERFGFSEIQANAILEMRLYQLTNLESSKLKEEYEELQRLIAKLIEILSSDANVLKVVKEELIEDTKPYLDNRRTNIIEAEMNIFEIEDLLHEESMVVTMSHKGFIKRTPSSDFKLQGKGGVGVSAGALRDDDFIKHMFVASTHSFMLFFTDKGNVFQLKVHQIPQYSRSARGEIIKMLFGIAPDENITALLNLSDYENKSLSIFIATKKGVVKKVAIDEFRRINQNGKRAITLREDDSVVDVLLTTGHDDIILATKKGKALKIGEQAVRVMGRVAGGVRGIKLREGDQLCGVCPVREDGLMMLVTENGLGKRLEFDAFTKHARGTSGQMYFRYSEEKGCVAAVLSVKEEDDIMVIASKGQMIRIGSDKISKQGRTASGIRLVRITKPDFVVTASVVHKVEEDKTTETVDNVDDSGV